MIIVIIIIIMIMIIIIKSQDLPLHLSAKLIVTGQRDSPSNYTGVSASRGHVYTKPRGMNAGGTLARTHNGLFSKTTCSLVQNRIKRRDSFFLASFSVNIWAPSQD